MDIIIGIMVYLIGALNLTYITFKITLNKKDMSKLDIDESVTVILLFILWPIATIAIPFVQLLSIARKLLK